MTKEKNILTTLADNPALIDAVKTVLLKQFELPKEVDPRADDTLLGQKVRAYIAGASAVKNAFKEIGQHKTVPDSPKRENPAR